MSFLTDIDVAQRSLYILKSLQSATPNQAIYEIQETTKKDVARVAPIMSSGGR